MEELINSLLEAVRQSSAIELAPASNLEDDDEFVVVMYNYSDGLFGITPLDQDEDLSDLDLQEGDVAVLYRLVR